MRDEALRALERAWEASGQHPDGLALRRAQRQAGRLHDGQLGLAAYCGDAIALELLGERLEGQPVSPLLWLRGLSPWGDAALARALLWSAWATLADAGAPPELLEALAAHARGGPRAAYEAVARRLRSAMLRGNIELRVALDAADAAALAPEPGLRGRVLREGLEWVLSLAPRAPLAGWPGELAGWALSEAAGADIAAPALPGEGGLDRRAQEAATPPARIDLVRRLQALPTPITVVTVSGEAIHAEHATATYESLSLRSEAGPRVLTLEEVAAVRRAD